MVSKLLDDLLGAPISATLPILAAAAVVLFGLHNTAMGWIDRAVPEPASYRGMYRKPPSLNETLRILYGLLEAAVIFSLVLLCSFHFQRPLPLVVLGLLASLVVLGAVWGGVLAARVIWNDRPSQPNAHLSARTAIVIGTIWVNIPVLPLMFMPMAIYVIELGPEAHQRATPLLFLWLIGTFLLGFAIAWVWWSTMVPQWRVWAWPRVDDLAELKRLAIRAGIIWPEGSFFEKTEIRSKSIQAKLLELEGRRRSNA
jgi:hypothetical protein